MPRGFIERAMPDISIEALPPVQRKSYRLHYKYELAERAAREAPPTLATQLRESLSFERVAVKSYGFFLAGAGGSFMLGLTVLAEAGGYSVIHQGHTIAGTIIMGAGTIPLAGAVAMGAIGLSMIRNTDEWV